MTTATCVSALMGNAAVPNTQSSDAGPPPVIATRGMLAVVFVQFGFDVAVARGVKKMYGLVVLVPPCAPLPASLVPKSKMRCQLFVPPVHVAHISKVATVRPVRMPAGSA